MGRNYDRSKFMFLSCYYICSPFPCSILSPAARSDPGAGSLSCVIIDQPFIQHGSLYFGWIGDPLSLLQTKIQGCERKWEGTVIDQSLCFSPVTISAAHSLAVF